jgi:putative FmdB family regulatory protein
MPIYEFYCPDCHTVFSFFSSAIDTTASPSCPKCGRAALGRKPSRFAALRGGQKDTDESADEGPFGDLDDERMERAMEAMAGEMGGMEGDGPEDPRALARMLRKFGDATGLAAGPRMEEMLRRLEAGEDPDALEEEMGGEGEGEDGDLSDFFQVRKAAKAARRPRVDDTLYFL